MRLIFAGTPEFAAVALARLLDAGHTVALVLTQPDRPAGRGLKLQASPVKQLAQQHGIAVAQPRSLRLDAKYPEDALAAQQMLQAAQADAMVVAAYGLILPQWALDLPRLGCFNIHASLLPRWRGAAPIHRAIEAGDAATGITIMQMDAGLDTGDMLLRQSLPIGASDTTASLHDKLAVLGGGLMVQALEQAAQGALQPQVQPCEGVTYADKIDKHEALIDWTQPAAVVVRRVRAFNPFPVCNTHLDGEMLKVWAAQGGAALPVGAQPGTVLSVSPNGMAVAAGDAMVVVTELQRAGARRMPLADVLRGFAVPVGAVLR